MKTNITKMKRDIFPMHLPSDLPQVNFQTTDQKFSLSQTFITSELLRMRTSVIT